MSENNDSSRRDKANNRPGNAENYRAPSSDSSSPSRARSENNEVADTEQHKTHFTRSEWENLSSDPDIRTDLGYEITQWETIETATDSDQVIYMPQNEELLRDDTFIVANEAVLCDLGKYY